MCHLMKLTQLLTLALIIALVACGPATTLTPPPTSILPTPISLALTPLPVATSVPTPTSFANSATLDAKQLGTDLDSMMQKITKAGLFSGAVLVAQNGQVILSKGYGLADREKKTPNTAQTKFRIASITKQFTAMAIMLLQEQGKLNVQDKICKYLKDCPATWQSITIYQLLTHTSGIPNTTGMFYMEGITLSRSLEQTIADAKARPLAFRPGEKWSYSHTGYNLLGKIIEAASGESYDSFLQKNIFWPLEMSSTGYNLDQSDLAVGYPDQFNPAHEINLSDPYSAAGLYSTAEDLYRWDQALYTDRLVPQKTLDMIFAAQVQVPNRGGIGYGYGWMTAPPEQGHIVFHFGGIVGFTSFIGRYLDAKATIIILTNQGDVDPSATGDLIYKKLFGVQQTVDLKGFY